MAFLKKLSSLRKRRSLQSGRTEQVADGSPSAPSTNLPDVNETPEPPKPSTKLASGTAPPASIPGNRSAQQQHQLSPNISTSESSFLAQAQANKSNALQYQRLAFTQVGSTPPQLDAALSNINISIQLNPDDGISWKLKGIILQAAEIYEQACMAYTEAVARLEGPEKQIVQQTLSLLAILKQAQQAEATKRGQYIPPNPIAQTPLSTQTSTQTSPIAPARPTQLGLITPQPTAVEQTQASQGLPAPKPILLEPPSSSSVAHPLLEEIRALKHPKSRDLLMTLTRKCRGALYLVEFNGLGSVDQVALFFLGYNYTASQRLDMPRSPPALHPSWEKNYWRVQLSSDKRRFNYNFESLSLPGNEVFDFDCETIANYDGCHLGTASVRGYSEAYRLQQGSLPKGHASLEVFSAAQAWMERLSINALNENISMCSRAWSLDRIGATGLDEAIISYATSGNGAACATIQLTPPSFLSDVRGFSAFSSNIAKITTRDAIGLQQFLQHILMGELASVLVKNLAKNPRFPNKVQISPALCALIALARLWREHLAVRPVIGTNNWNLVPNHAQIHAEGLVRFAEALGWPYLNEACGSINETLKNFTSNMFGSGIHPYHLDWLLGLVLPGRYFRHQILTSLVLICAETREIGICPSFDSGLVIFDKSYWPKLTVLGRILSSLDHSKVTCGWVRPLPAPKVHGLSLAWARIEAKPVPLLPPLSLEGLSHLQSCGFEQEYDPSDPKAFPIDLANLSKWNPPRALPPRPSSFKIQGRVELQAVRLSEVASPANTAGKTYRARLEFSSHSDEVSFTIRFNPLFVHVPNCEGTTHPIHDRLTHKLFDRLVYARQLNNGAIIPTGTGLIIINAMEPGEEAMARAWCGEVGKNAIVRKGGQGCFTCAVNLAVSRTGLNFHTLIWCS
ncbi:unnamed protein product [Clonostachys chloroleuca]|uniref:Uncharacterized protein n=1 Tax=Clonostachys chloroleuca TaxID=1926264 RepID=A0AA35Q3U4_9HYPO|nr:unnamed protein product [Clonostachys chloroleuca]